MSFLKRIIFVLFGTIILVIILSFFLPSNLKVEKRIVVDSSKELVFNQVNNLNNWKNWTVWFERDSSIYSNVKAFSENSEGVGANVSWNSRIKEVGVGSLKIVVSKPFELIEAITNFGFGDTKSYWYINLNEGKVEVVWGVNIDFGFNVFSKWNGLFIKDRISDDLDQGLKKLKLYVEELPKINSGIVTQKFIDKPQWFFSIREIVKGNEVGSIHSKLFNEISSYMEENGIPAALSPLTIYHSWSDTLVDVEAGLLLEDSIIVKHNRIKLNRIRPGNVVTASHYGSYQRMPETYFSINEWMRKNQVVVIGAPWEVYIVDPSIEENPEKWITEIYFPIK